MHIFLHLLNDFSGSPRIINEKIRCYQKLGLACFVVTNSSSGFISLDAVEHKLIPYAKHSNKIAWAFNLFLWHLRAFFFILGKAGKGDTVHCNTMLTAPHLFAARLKGARAVAHLMEIRVSPAVHKNLMLFFVKRYADKVIYLSRYVKQELGGILRNSPDHITYPCIDPDILAAARHALSSARPEIDRLTTRHSEFTVCLICSLIWHKGFREFVQLAWLCPEFRFELIINGTAENFHQQIPQQELPSNLVVRFNVKQISVILQNVDLLVSLTKREGWIETFGLTLIEAMAFSLPVIAPGVGAPTEFIVNKGNGYLVDESDLPNIARIIRQLQGSASLYQQLAASALETSERFTPARFLDAIKSEAEFIAS